jgi:hypothetical protein
MILNNLIPHDLGRDSSAERILQMSALMNCSILAIIKDPSADTPGTPVMPRARDRHGPGIYRICNISRAFEKGIFWPKARLASERSYDSPGIQPNVGSEDPLDKELDFGDVK